MDPSTNSNEEGFITRLSYSRQINSRQCIH